MVADNIFLAELSVNVPPKPAGDVRIDVRFTYDINGILDVDISVPLTGLKIVWLLNRIRGINGRTNTAVVVQIKPFKIHPRDEQINRAFIARLDNLYQLTPGGNARLDKQLLPSFQLSTREAGS